MLSQSSAAAFMHTSTVLQLNLMAHALVCLLLSLVIYMGPVRWVHRAGLCVGLLRIVWLVVSLYVSQIWPVKNYTLVFPTLYSLSIFAVVCMSFEEFVIVFSVTHVLYATCFYLTENITAAFVIRFAVSSLAVWMFNVWVEEDKRRRWRLHHVFHCEMKRFEDILNDLLPQILDQTCTGTADQDSTFAQPVGHTSEHSLYSLNGLTACHERAALMLQIDIVGFTEFSRKLSPLELAHTMHHIFSAFDSSVQSLGLFKMDTVGDVSHDRLRNCMLAIATRPCPSSCMHDLTFNAFMCSPLRPHVDLHACASQAYIVAVVIPRDSLLQPGAPACEIKRESAQHTSDLLLRHLCHKMLRLAGSMLDTIGSYRTKHGHTISARIGMAARAHEFAAVPCFDMSSATRRSKIMSPA